MNTMQFILGQRYTRQEIHDAVGGEMVIYLPAKNGTVVAGCFDPELNKRAPTEVDVGSASKVIRRARSIGETKPKLPIFLKRATHEWEYMGVYRCNRLSEARRDIEAYEDRRKDAVGVLYFEEIVSPEVEVTTDADLFQFHGKEGREVLVIHLAKERSRGLVAAKRNSVRAIHGCLLCEACDLRETSLLPKLGEACFEVHHNTPLKTLTAETRTTLADVSLVCAICHRMIHRSNPMITVAELNRRLVAVKAK